MRQSSMMFLQMRRPSSSLAVTLFVAMLSTSSYSLASSPSSTTSSAAAASISSSSISVSDGYFPLVSTGLLNCGNTCYMAAQLQCAFHIPLVRSIVLKNSVASSSSSSSQHDLSVSDAADPAKQGSNNQEQVESSSSSATTSSTSSIALQALRHLFQDMLVAAQNRVGLAVSPTKFCRSLGINILEQQDSQEFWKLLLPALQSKRLADLYQGAFEDYIIALDGSGREKRREEAFLDLSLDVSSSSSNNNNNNGDSSLSSSVMSALQVMFGTPELLSVKEGNGWRPQSGADKVDAHKGSLLQPQGLPPILQLHLKRFHYDWQTDTTRKLNNPFAFPLELDLSPLQQSKEAGSSTSTSSDEDDDADSLLMVYDLQAIIVHAGEYGSGHYYAYVRPDIRSDVWYRFNDHHVDQVSYQDVYVDACGGKASSSGDLPPKPSGNWRLLERVKRVLMHRNSYGYGGRTSNAYVLQYVRRKDIPMLYYEESSD